VCSATVTEAAAAVSSGREHNNTRCMIIRRAVSVNIHRAYNNIMLYNTDNDFSTYTPIPADITYIRISYVISSTEFAKLII